ncbi:beta-galactosidase [Paenibacillus macquariensis]|uniref:Beta-galactosidase n=1 Tax=Paenibacillus macquariensis TaxID=948756 RepID=A0ABY1KC76_9BACL|nr:beta-galactosidase [Paenibacillus macquariensis]MEC0089620.1 beta-galactosidase [Paenibacillus macquariensis]OAB30889.1 beta-galactosidase [Paenibacillus macquariensis subsp. macquariensis]SIR58473.1 beta-galactosidase [Paenibacillus macquariensis]
MSTFTIEGKQFVYNGKPIRILSGAIHYFRVVPEYWEDRLVKLKACGLNTVEIYVPWNLHEPIEGEFNFERMADVIRFVRLADEQGLFVIVRPSPYICAEWEFGGLPAWLLKEDHMRLRCSHPSYLAKIDAYYDILIPKFLPLLCTNGGPIIDAADALDQMLNVGASVNFYMFHGGTNFGFYNGANDLGKYESTVTSYDYDALLNESGDITDKYMAVREVIVKYAEIEQIALPPAIPKKHFGEVRFREQARLFDSLSQLTTPIQSPYPEAMERFGQDYGFILYTSRVKGPLSQMKLAIQEVRDRALVFLDGVFQGVVERNTHDVETDISDGDIVLDIPAQGAVLSILVENQGRINYGYKLKDPKGITEGVRLGLQFLYDWTIHTLPLNDLAELVFKEEQTNESFTPTFYKGRFQVEGIGDTFLKLEGWTKGIAYVNGFNLGRYWEIGPQKTLYIPAPLLREGDNELIIFELHGTEDPIVTLQDFAELG